MLRALVVLLLVANGLFFAWSQGWLDRLTGVPAQGEREPQRVASQVRPELVQLSLPASAGAGPAPKASAVAAAASGTASGAASAVQATTSARAAAGPASTASSAPKAVALAASAVPAAASASAAPAAVAATKPPPGPAPPASGAAGATSSAAAPAPVAACLEAGPFTPAEAGPVEAALRTALPSGAWAQRKADGSGEWMIYMGPYPDREFMDRKKAELSRIRGGVPQEEVQAPPELARGLSLGRYPSPAAANAALAQYRLRGIRTARVVRSGNGPPVVFLRVARADPALAAQVSALKLPVAGRSFTACPGPR